MDDIRKLSEIFVTDILRKELLHLDREYGFSPVRDEKCGTAVAALGLLQSLFLTFMVPGIAGSLLLTLLVCVLGGCVGYALGLLAYRTLYRYWVSVMPALLKWRHEELRRLLTEIDNFNCRLKGLQQLAELSAPDERPGPDVAAKYFCERVELAARYSGFLEDGVRQEKAKRRESAIRSLEKAFAENDDGKFRETRDVSDAVYLHLVRSADEKVLMIEDEESDDQDAVPSSMGAGPRHGQA